MLNPSSAFKIDNTVDVSSRPLSVQRLTGTSRVEFVRGSAWASGPLWHLGTLSSMKRCSEGMLGHSSGGCCGGVTRRFWSGTLQFAPCFLRWKRIYLGSIPGWGQSLGEGHGYPLQYACLENSMNRGAWQATVHGIAKHQTWLSD